MCKGNQGNPTNSVKYPCILNKKRILHPLLSTSTMSITSHHNAGRNGGGDKHISKRILSAKDHRLKQLQNQLADAHFHLNELANENKLLRNLQKRMDSALQRYEGVDGDIPKIFNSHNEEIRSWQVRFKQLRLKLKDTNQRLKEKDFEFQQLKDEHQHLLTLSKDSKLQEREKLQHQVNDLTEKLKQQTETMNTLQKRLNLESKSCKRQIHFEIQKHKETETKLNNALNECEKLNSMIEKKDRIISSIIPKKSPKINLSNPALNIEDKKDSFNLNLLINGSSLTDSQLSNESSKIENRSASTFTISENKFIANSLKNGNHFKNESYFSSDSNVSTVSKDHDLTQSIRDGMHHMNLTENGEKTLQMNLNDNTKNRVDILKKQLSKKQAKNSNIIAKSKYSNSKLQNSNALVRYNPHSDSSSEDIINSPFDFKESNLTKQSEEDTLVPILNLENEIVQNNDDFFTDAQFKIDDDINEKLQELEEKAVKERFMVENVLQKHFDQMLNNEEKNTEFYGNASPKINNNIINKQRKPTEVNNNDKLANRKVSSDLNEEKKQRLLATLKAIDLGEDDGLNFENIPKIKTPEKKFKN